MDNVGIYRVLDANLNRLREGVRVLEEYFRFVVDNPAVATRYKELRHHLQEVEAALDSEQLLAGRDSESDPFASGMVAKEGQRESMTALLVANMRRAQEAARVIEEYSKLLSGGVAAAEGAKQIRFALYTLEKETNRAS